MGQVHDFDASLAVLRKPRLRDLAGPLQPCHGPAVASEHEPPLLPQVLQAVLEDILVEVHVVGAEGALRDDAAVDAHEGKVEVAAAHVAHEDVAPVPGLVRERVGDSAGRRRLDKVHDAQPRQVASHDDRLSLVLAVVRRHCDHSVCHRPAELVLCVVSEVGEEHGHQLLRSEAPLLPATPNLDQRPVVLAALHLGGPMPHVPLHPRVVDPEADEPLGREDRVLHVPIGLVPCGIAN
mmetsp:Transcript_136079/g.379278  ORF Transcript_136079/g.379278 Transcript_136079/m.379278 type:complete len:237 (+) Transcript_136079:794-1504(+)